MSQVDKDVDQQGKHVATAVVAGDVGVKFLPLAFDAVVVGAGGRQQVQLDAFA